MQNKLQEKPDGTGVHSSLWKLALYIDLGEERLSTFYILNGSSLPSINGSYFQGKWRHDDLCNAQPCQSCTTGSTATPRRRNCLLSEKSSTSSKNPDWRPIKRIYLQDNDSPHPQVILALGQRRSSSPARAESAAGDVSSAWRGRKGPRHTHPANPHSRIWQSRGCRESGNVETGISLPPREWREQGAHRARGRTRVEAQRGPRTGVLPIPGTSHRSRSPRHRACCRLLPSRNFASLMETVARANSLLPRPAAPISASRAPPAGRGLPVDPGKRARLAPHQEGGGVEVAWPGHARGHPAGPRPAAGRPLPPSPPPSLRLPAPNPTLPRLLPSQLTPAPRPPGGRRGPQPKEGAQLGRPGD